MNREEEYEFYAQPENQTPQGPGRRRKAAMTAMVPLRLPEEMLRIVREMAKKQDRSVSSWIRQAVRHELERQQPEAASRNVHIVPSQSGGWDVVASDPLRGSQHAESQAAAIDCARKLIRRIGGGELVVHGRDGGIRDSDRIRVSKDPKTP